MTDRIGTFETLSACQGRAALAVWLLSCPDGYIETDYARIRAHLADISGDLTRALEARRIAIRCRRLADGALPSTVRLNLEIRLSELREMARLGRE